MSSFFVRGFREYKRHIAMKKAFVEWAERLKTILMSVDIKVSGGEAAERARIYNHSSLLLMPLVEIAWSDGRITRGELDPIVQAAGVYGLVETSDGYRELMEDLLSRPAPSKVDAMWDAFGGLLKDLPDDSRKLVSFGLLSQAQFVAEQGSDSVIEFLRGERITINQEEALLFLANQLEKAKEVAVEADIKKIVAARLEIENTQRGIEEPAVNGEYFREAEGMATLDDYAQLIPLVPLVKTAWAEGRVTKRERHLVFEAAARMGIKDGSTAHQRLAEWLELHPTDEFYDLSLDILRQRWQHLDADEKSQRKFDVLADCTRIAEASGGSANFPAGGVKICDEEIHTVKLIAKKLNIAATV
ncbi:MAG: hypothetical protein IPG22_07650 [Acidobacteria bacterium]|nr:hypothetical protein [Acidobacteriota bacterium]